MKIFLNDQLKIFFKWTYLKDFLINLFKWFINLYFYQKMNNELNYNELIDERIKEYK